MPRKTCSAAAPRPAAAPRFNEAAARCRGKPAQVPPRPSRRRRARFNEAAARCRGKPVGGLLEQREDRRASMRPRPDAAENSPARHAAACGISGFNEAAARCRGKRGPPATPVRTRPSCFNEAAARCRGKRRPARPRRTSPPGFNEAAARCRGKRRTRRQPRRAHAASMRPRPDAAENGSPAMVEAECEMSLQ